MTSWFGRFVSAIAAVWFLGCSAASACNVGDIQCENGYKYTCKCWTSSGCNYERDGTCHHEDGIDPPAAIPHSNLPANKYVREARLVCASARTTAAPGACPGH